MKLQPSVLFLILVFCFTFSANTQNSAAKTDDEESVVEPAPAPTRTPIPEATFTPLPEATPTLVKSPKRQAATKGLVIHKPMPSPSWGKVIQYHRDQIFALTDKNREIVHEFLFQDDEGIVRTALFHENSEGNGYWEVWVWDQQ